MGPAEEVNHQLEQFRDVLNKVLGFGSLENLEKSNIAFLSKRQ